MCTECYSTPCNPRCPNAPEPPTVHTCAECKDSIVVGQDYYDVCGVPYCEDCVNCQTAEREEMGKDE